MSAVTVDLPYPPSANRLWRVVKGKPIKSAEYRGWLESAAWLVKAATGPRGLKGPYGLSVAAGRPDKRARDLDNLLKPLSDAMKAGGAIRDDSDCQKIEARWESGLTGVRVTVLATVEIPA